MDIGVQKHISNLVERQFPRFYNEQGQDFILFLKAYYEWLEENGNPIFESRRLIEYRDIDNTLEDFLEYFQKKYLYGIPFSVISNKRFLLKHILDVYRSKGSIQCYKLLFKLIYNEDVEIYLPSKDILRASSAEWQEPRYLELTGSDILFTLNGKTIKGLNTNTTAVIEKIITEPHNKNIINKAYISNIYPKGSDFEIGEKVVDIESALTPELVNQSPSIIGSLERIEVTQGGQNFKIGDIIKISDVDGSNNFLRTSFGSGGLLRVSNVASRSGFINFSIVDGGFGYSLSSKVFVYRTNDTGVGASFELDEFSNIQRIQYNSDVILDYETVLLNDPLYEFPDLPSANISSVIGEALEIKTESFGTILSLDREFGGNNYNAPVDVFVKSVLDSTRPLVGNVVFTTDSNTVTGTSTEFEKYITVGSVIGLQANVSSSVEYTVVKEVVSNTELTLYSPPSVNSYSDGKYRFAPDIFTSNYGVTNNTVQTIEAEITGLPAVGNNIVTEAFVIDSGKGYVDGETIQAYLYNSISENIDIVSSGIGYANNETVYFSGGRPSIIAVGYLTTDSNGSITEVTLTERGSGYEYVPTVAIKTANGSGGLVECSLQEYTFFPEINGKVIKTAVGRKRGFWDSTEGFLNSNKYIQDSYYYQDFSYEIRVPIALNKYKEILYNSFHPSGSELFGSYTKNMINDIDIKVTQEELIFYDDENVLNLYPYASETGFTADSNTITIDKYFI